MSIGINQTASPLKLCFFIEPDSTNNFERAIKIACSYWGGIFSPILPLYSVFTSEFTMEYRIDIDPLTYYKKTIENFDPDIVLYDNSLDTGFIKSVIGDRLLIAVEEFLSNTENNNIKYGISIPQVISHLVESEFKYARIDNLKLSLPITETSDLFLKCHAGCLIDSFRHELRSNLNKYQFFEEPEINYDNIGDIFPTENFTTQKIIRYAISSIPERNSFKGEAIYFLDETRLNDIINYWNLRALGWIIIPVPLSHIENKYFTDFIENFSRFKLRRSENLSMISFQLSVITTEKQKEQIQQKLKSIQSKIEGNISFPYQGWFPRFWEERSILEADKVLCEKIEINSSYTHVEVQDNYVKFTTEKLPINLYNDYHLNCTHKALLTFSYFDEYLQDAGLVYGIDTSDWMKLTRSHSREKWRLSNTGLCYYVRSELEEVSFFIPKSIDFFKVYFLKRGNKLTETSNGRLANEVLKNIGGIRGSYILESNSSLKILELIEDGKAVHHPQLMGEIKKNLNINNNEKVEFYIKTLLENKIIEFGSILQCEVCHQRGFYTPSEILKTITCAICRNNFDLPMHKPNEIKWAYRGIGPFSKNNKVGGVITVFLTLKLFNQEFTDTSGNMSAVIGFELKKGIDTTEVDLAVLLEEKYKDRMTPDLVFCECKTYKKFTPDDADRMIKLGNEFPNSILTFATLNAELEEVEKAELSKVVNHFRTGVGSRPKNPVLILTGKELLPKKFWDHFSEYEEHSKPYYRYNDWLGNLCELSVKKHLSLKTWGEIQSDMWQEHMKKRNEAKKEHINKKE